MTDLRKSMVLALSNKRILLLRLDAVQWWYNAKLIREGKVQEAEERINRSVREHVDVLSRAVFATVARGGWTIYYKSHHPYTINSTLSGYGGLDNYVIQTALLLGIPVCDSTTIPDNLIVQMLGLPMPTFGEPDPLPYHSISRVHWREVFWLYEQLGASLYNTTFVKGEYHG